MEMMRVGVVVKVDCDDTNSGLRFFFGADGDDYSYILTRIPISFISYLQNTNA